MGIVELLGLAASVSLLSGWRLYLTVFATGLAMKSGYIDLPENLAMLDVLANPWVLSISALGAVAEFFADKIAWLDSIWDGLNTLIRPLGGALLALAVVDSGDPVWQVVVFLLGGGAALVSHGTKAGARAAVNTSPEPFSNVALSTVEDVATGGLLVLAFANPVVAAVILLIMTVIGIYVVHKSYRFIKGIFTPEVSDSTPRPPAPPPS